MAFVAKNFNLKKIVENISFKYLPSTNFLVFQSIKYHRKSHYCFIIFLLTTPLSVIIFIM